jgi:hypothetical protein
MRVLITRGRERVLDRFRSEWQRYDEARLVALDLHTGDARVVATHRTPPERCAPHHPAITFKAGEIADDVLWLSTQTEVMAWDLATGREVVYLSLPRFNDLHHVMPLSQGRLVVANTGLDMVCEMTSDGEVVREWNVLGEEPWARFRVDTDYRRIATTKPHLSHPNFLFVRAGDLYVTRFEQRDAVALGTEAPAFSLDTGRPHDGVFGAGSRWFTTVNGMLLRFHDDDPDCREVHDLNQYTGSEQPLGWCRGVCPLDEDHVLVGFTRLRRTKTEENLRWVLRKFGSHQTLTPAPTRVDLFDLQLGVRAASFSLESQDLNAVFSILPLPRRDTIWPAESDRRRPESP